MITQVTEINGNLHFREVKMAELLETLHTTSNVKIQILLIFNI